ncbi:MAG: Crp/Fnr family transcriptional regulator [Acidobacteriia bacterium]|nr:Crp/Fnr family transcriptional regulator [Terriglobia bacterium]
MQVPYGLHPIEDCETCFRHAENCFCELPAPARKLLQEIKYTSYYPAGSLLFVEGQAPRGVYLLCEGRVKLQMASPEGKTLILRIAGPGEVLGMHAAIPGKPFEHTAETLQPSQVSFLKTEDFVRLLQQFPQASAKVLGLLSDHYRAACYQVRCLGLSRSAGEKIARFLLASSEQGQETRKGTRFHLALTHEEIAQLLGVSRETVTRTLTEFRKELLISIRGSAVTIRNKTGLKGLLAA